MQMTDTKFMTAKEKEAVLKAWEKFLKSDCAWDKFSDSLYKHLITHCSFIAHYDRSGFYNCYFKTATDTVRFLEQFDKSKGNRSTEMGHRYWLDGDYADINPAMVSIAGKYLPELYKKCNDIERDIDIQTARQLLSKHGLVYEIREMKARVP